jgi:hypothetical protein
MVQVPADTSVTVVTDTVQTGSVLEVKVTVRGDVVEALNVTGPALMATSDKAAKVIVWGTSVTWKLWLMGVATA